MTGCLLALALTYFPVFSALTRAANPALAAAQGREQGGGHLGQQKCSFQFNPTGMSKFTSSCDIANRCW